MVHIIRLILFVFLFFGGICFGEDGIPSSGDISSLPQDGISFSGEVFSGDIGGEVITTDGTTTENTTGENLSGSIQPSPLVVIKEIFPKDTDYFPEYLGLLFLADFSGTVRIVGLGNGSSEKSVEVNVLSGQTIFITDTTSKITTTSQQQLYGLSSITLTDNGESLEVFIDSIIQDKVVYTQSSQTQAITCGEERTGEGFRICAGFMLPGVQSIYINPSIDNSTGTILTGGEVGTGYIPPTSPGEANSPQEEQNPLLISPFRIDEIYPYTDIFPEYIEIVALEKYTGSIIIGGAGQGTSSKTIQIDTSPGIRRILTNDPTKFSFYPFVIGVPGLSLTNNGEQVDLFLPNGQEIDSVVYSGPQAGKSLLFSQDVLFTPNISRGVYTEIVPTPGYVLGMIAHHFLEEQSLPVCGIHRQHTSTLSSDKKLNVQAVVDGSLLQNSATTYACERVFSGSEITYFTGCNPSYLQFEPGLWPVTLRISKNNTPLCELTQELNLPTPLSTKLGTKNESEMSYYEGLYRKRKEKYELLAKEIRSKGYTISLQGELKGGEKTEKSIPNLPQELLGTGPGSPLFVIHSVLPNPKGKDTLGERLVLENISDETIYSDSLMITRGSSSNGLSGGITFPPGKLVELVGNIGLPNSPTCFGLRFRKETEPIALFCYPQLAEDEVYTGGMVGFERMEEQERLRDLSLVVTSTESCVQIGGQEVLCKSLPYPVEEVKQRKADSKKLISVTKKVVTLQEKYDLRREKYATLSKNNKKREAALTLRNRELRTDISSQKMQKNMFYSLYWLLRKKIGAERKPLYSSPTMQQLTFLYDKLVFFQDTPMMDLGPVHMSPDEVDAWFELYFEGKIPSEHTKSSDVVMYLTRGIHETENLFGLLLK